MHQSSPFTDKDQKREKARWRVMNAQFSIITGILFTAARRYVYRFNIFKAREVTAQCKRVMLPLTSSLSPCYARPLARCLRAACLVLNEEALHSSMICSEACMKNAQTHAYINDPACDLESRASKMLHSTRQRWLVTHGGTTRVLCECGLINSWESGRCWI